MPLASDQHHVARFGELIKRSLAGQLMMWGFTCQRARPSAMMLPQEGVAGGMPAPMKERIASMIMALAQI